MKDKPDCQIQKTLPILKDSKQHVHSTLTDASQEHSTPMSIHPTLEVRPTQSPYDDLPTQQNVHPLLIKEAEKPHPSKKKTCIRKKKEDVHPTLVQYFQKISTEKKKFPPSKDLKAYPSPELTTNVKNEDAHPTLMHHPIISAPLQMTKLLKVQENKVRSRVNAIEWNMKFEQIELTVGVSDLVSDKQDNTSAYWAQGNRFLGKEHPWKAVPEEGVPVGLEDQQHHQGDDPLYHEVKVAKSGTGKVQKLTNVMTFIPGSSTGKIRQAAGDPGELCGQQHGALHDVPGVGGCPQAEGGVQIQLLPAIDCVQGELREQQSGGLQEVQVVGGHQRTEEGVQHQLVATSSRHKVDYRVAKTKKVQSTSPISKKTTQKLNISSKKFPKN